MIRGMSKHDQEGREIPAARPDWMARHYVMQAWLPVEPQPAGIKFPTVFGWCEVTWAVICAGTLQEAEHVAWRYGGLESAEVRVAERTAESRVDEWIVVVMQSTAEDGAVPLPGFLIVERSKRTTFDRGCVREARDELRRLGQGAPG